MPRCPECGAMQPDGHSCQDDFYTLLGWETEYPGYGEVHHLTVLCYHLQHPSLYSTDGLAYGKQLLVDFLEKGKSTKQIRRENRSRVSPGGRTWKIKGKPGALGSYANPPGWTMTAADIANDDHRHYIENVRRWAASILNSLKPSNNL